MNKILIIALLLTTFSLQATSLSYNESQKIKNINKAQNIFRHKLQRKCGYTAAHFAQKHTQAEWTTLKSEGLFKQEFSKICPKGSEVVKEEWVENLFLFANEYAKDSLKRPRC